LAPAAPNIRVPGGALARMPSLALLSGSWPGAPRAAGARAFGPVQRPRGAIEE